MNSIFTTIRQVGYTIFAFLFFLVMAFVMTVVGFVLITCGGATDRHKHQYHELLQRLSHFVVNHVPGTTFTYSNAHGETFEQPAIIISNHQSHLDLMGIMMLTPNLIILTKDWVWKNPFYGLVIRYADFFPVYDTEEMIGDLSKMVEKGYSIMIFPEGTRSEDCSILRFHRGAFYIAERMNLDIIPVFIKGFGKVLPKKSSMLHPGPMSVEVMPRVRRQDLTAGDDYRRLTSAMRKAYIKKNV